ncbi:shikimate kinase [Natrononativus amylolyticus]|uniref:shikimate kinase n=1 Tax=Natrononativus amylolyticus TaxID=2963434 RepID=UPI0020CFA971|nr:shikimate kinase [Natrononativus amylolyticus]
MNGQAAAPAAGTVLNALATGTGSAFAIDLETTAAVELVDDGEVTAEIAGHPDADTALVERCVERTLERYAADAGLAETAVGADVRTESEVPMASGLKSSSAAANATVLATLDALEIADAVEPVDACRLGVQAARDAGVTATGAFDDASASMLGGVTVTDNTADELLARERVEWEALIYTPPERSFSADADVSACERIAPLAELIAELALEGRYGEAMSVNGFAFCAALEFPTAPLLEALPAVDGVSLSGTGPSYVAVGDRTALEDVRERWEARAGTTRLVETRNDGARTL